MKAVDKGHEHIDAEISLGKLEICFAARSKDADNRTGKELKTQKCNNGNHHDDTRCRQIGFFHTRVILRAVIEAEDRLAALADAHNKCHKQDVDLGDNAYTGKRDIAAIKGKRAIIGQCVVQGNLHSRHGQLIEAGRSA